MLLCNLDNGRITNIHTVPASQEVGPIADAWLRYPPRKDAGQSTPRISRKLRAVIAWMLATI
jgi:hypothetical protein